MRELFESIFRVIMNFFFLSVVDSNTCDKSRTLRARITCNNARNIDFRYLKGYKQEEFISLRFLRLFGIRKYTNNSSIFRPNDL